MLTAVGSQIDEALELLMEKMSLLGEHAIRSAQGRLFLRRQRGLEHSELIPDLQHLEVLCPAHLGMLDIHCVMSQ
jgi:hypothetical protein